MILLTHLADGHKKEHAYDGKVETRADPIGERFLNTFIDRRTLNFLLLHVFLSLQTST